MKFASLIESGEPQRIGSQFQFTEGPVWMPEAYLLFSDIRANRICKRFPDGSFESWREPSGNANGLTLDRQNRLLVCEQGNRLVSRIEADGARTPLAERYDDKLLNSPNDIVCRSDGTIYFTDPPYGIIPGQSSSYSKPKEQPVNGLYRILIDGTVERIAEDIDCPNGLAFSPDESILYVNDTPRRLVRAFDVQADGRIANSRIFADMDHAETGSPDGMKVDTEGHLYVAGATGIWVFEPSGTLLGVIATPELPTNCAWGDDDRKTLYITARTSLFRIRVNVPGLGVGGV